MEELSWLLLLVSFLFLASIIAIVVLVYCYFSLRAQMDTRIREEVKVWRDREIESVRKEQEGIALREAEIQLQRWKAEQEQLIRQDAIQKSRAVTLGKITEHFIPYLPDFAYNPKDARFMGSPIDFVVFDGLSEGEVRDIIFVEVKTGTSALTTRERRIRDAIQSGRVLWKECRRRPESA